MNTSYCNNEISNSITIIKKTVLAFFFEWIQISNVP